MRKVIQASFVTPTLTMVSSTLSLRDLRDMSIQGGDGARLLHRGRRRGSGSIELLPTRALERHEFRDSDAVDIQARNLSNTPEKTQACGSCRNLL